MPQPPEQVFQYVMPVDLPTIVNRWGPLPGVAAVRDQSGEWDHVGATRTVVLDDGSENKEELVAVNPPHHFGYRLGLGAPLSLLASEAAGTWWFRPTDGGGTEIEWTWALAARPGTGPLVEFGVGPLWRAWPTRRWRQ